MSARPAAGAEAIVALDYSDAAAALAMVDRLRGHCGFFKIGHELFTANGPRIVEEVRGRGADVFLDLKFHDIPNTVRGGVRSAASLGVRLVTVHASGGAAMLEAAVDGAGDACGVLAVSVLTSLTAPPGSGKLGRREVDVADEVLRLAALADTAGVHGLVCSGQEASRVRERLGDRLALLIPGIRLAGGATHDQARVVTPEAAVAAGARYLVLGRAVTGAADPVAAMAAVSAAMRVGGRE